MRYKIYSINRTTSERSWYYHFKYVTRDEGTPESFADIVNDNPKVKHDPKYDIYVSVGLSPQAPFVFIPETSPFFNLDLMFKNGVDSYREMPTTPVRMVATSHSTNRAAITLLNRIASTIFDVADAIATSMLKPK